MNEYPMLALGFFVLMLSAAAAVLGTLCWQHVRYLRKRRGVVQDHQPLLHAVASFHVITLAKLAPGADLFTEARRLVSVLEGSAGARAVYAGKRLLIGLESQQLPKIAWDFALVCQYPSREAYERARKLPEVASIIASFERSFDQGMQRRVLLNLALPSLLLARRAWDIVRRRPARYPFQPDEQPGDPADADARERAGRIEALRKESELGREAVVVVNFLERGSPEQQAKDSAYGLEMMGLMAEQGHGPTHMGRAVTVEGDAHFDTIALVYYPGVEYFAEMVQGVFFGGIVGGKQPGDTLAIVTAPFLDRLQ